MDPDALGFQLLVDPLFPDDDADELEIERWKLQIRHIDERCAMRDEVTRQVFAIVMGQCSPTMVDRIKTSHDWDTILQQHDLIALLNITRKMGYLGNYPTPVWCLPDGNANILSLCDITWHYRVTMDTAVENAIILHGASKQQHRFIPSGKGLYKWEHTMDPTTNNPCWLFVTIIHNQVDHYTHYAYDCTQTARRLQNIIMHPASRHMSNIAISHLHNSPFTEEDIRAADDIFGLNLGSLKGKASKQTHPSRDLSSPSVHSRDSLGRGPLHGHRVCEQASIPGDIIMQSSLQHGGISPEPSGEYCHHMLEEGDPSVPSLWFSPDVYHL